jgi:hypothetical protein
LKGDVFQFFKALQKGLHVKPEQVKLSNLDPNLSRLVSALRVKEVRCKKDCHRAWGQDHKWLLPEVQALLKKEYQGIAKKWPPQL